VKTTAASYCRMNKRLLLLLAICPFFAVSVSAQEVLSPAPAGTLPVAATLPEGTPATQAAFLIDAALDIAYKDVSARPVVVKTAAALLPRLLSEGEDGGQREELTARWSQLAMTDDVSRSTRLDAYSAFFDVAARVDPAFARSWALKIPDASARSGGFLKVSRARTDKEYALAQEESIFAARAASQETDPLLQARALVFSAYSATELSPDRAPDAIRTASTAVSRLSDPAQRDNLYAELVGAAARYDWALARDMSNRISDEGLKGLATARINIAEVSQTTLTKKSTERVQALATAAAPYDSRALPFLLQLPPEESVVKAISQTLPRIYVTARPAIETSELERIWDYSQKAPASVYKDELQSRLSRLMVLKDLWRGRSWGKQLSWKGGRIQVGAFLKEVLEYRQSELKAGELQDVAKRNVQAAYSQSRNLDNAAQAEALLLLAGQILG
jgi:hypothetical protein